MSKPITERLMMALALDNCPVGMRMAAANVDPDGTARVELLERRLDIGWWNITTDQAITSMDMAQRFDDCVRVT